MTGHCGHADMRRSWVGGLLSICISVCLLRISCRDSGSWGFGRKKPSSGCPSASLAEVKAVCWPQGECLHRWGPLLHSEGNTGWMHLFGWKTHSLCYRLPPHAGCGINWLIWFLWCCLGQISVRKTMKIKIENVWENKILPDPLNLLMYTFTGILLCKWLCIGKKAIYFPQNPMINSSYSEEWYYLN